MDLSYEVQTLEGKLSDLKRKPKDSSSLGIKDVNLQKLLKNTVIAMLAFRAYSEMVMNKESKEKRADQYEMAQELSDSVCKNKLIKDMMKLIHQSCYLREYEPEESQSSSD